jgi:hypothetical protein
MKPLRIDFLPPRPLQVWMAALCGLLVLAALGVGAWAGWVHQEVAGLRQALAAQSAQHAQAAALATQAVVPISSPPPPYEADARRALREAQFDTAQALTALETVVVTGVLPVSVELQADGNLARVEVEFGDQSALLKYLAELNAGELAPRWQLLRATARASNQAVGSAVIESRIPMQSSF